MSHYYPAVRLSELDDGALRHIEVAGRPVLLVRIGTEVHAASNICPHAGRRLDWSPGKFLRSKDGGLVCAAHGATFELAAGVCIAGPCGRSILVKGGI